MEQKIKVLHLVESFAGGVFFVIQQICNNIDLNKFEVSIAYSYRPETPDNLEDYFDPRIHLIPLEMVRHISLYRDLKSGIEIYKLLKQIKPDVLHLASSKAGVLGRVFALPTKINRIFYSPHGYSFLMENTLPAKRKIYYGTEKLASLLPGKIIACSETEAQYTRKLAGTQKTVLINNGIDLDEIDRINRANSSSTESDTVQKIHIITVGRVEPQKGPETFIHVAQNLKKKHGDNIHFTWVGDGVLRSKLQNHCPDVEITGWLERTEVIRKVSAADIYIQTSKWEGLPLTILEAMALSKPVVATNIIGNKDAVSHGFTGYLCNHESAFITELDKLILSAELRKKLGRAGRKRAEENFSLQEMIKKITDCYTT